MRSINSLYEQTFLPWYKSENKQPISSDRFRRLFCEEFCIEFKIPKSDTCAECDYLIVHIDSIKGKNNNKDQLQDLESRKSLHRRKATAAQEKLLKLSRLAKSDHKKYHVICHDLQQALRTPKLTVGPEENCGPSTAVFTIVALRVAICFSGVKMLSNVELVKLQSCLLKYLPNNNVESEELHIMSDNCKGQNKNWSLIALYVSLVQSGRFRFIYLHFLVVGHTRLPCDKDFCRIELHARKHCPIMYTVDAWADCIFNAGKRKMFCITRMQQSDFKNMNILLSVISKKTMTQAKDPIRFSEASVFKVSSTIHFVLEISYSYQHETAVHIAVNTKKRGRPGLGFTAFNLPEMYSGPIPIDSKKHADLLALLRWIPTEYYLFYQELVSSRNTLPNFEAEMVDEQKYE